MPIYEYQCEVCDQRSEFMQKISDPPASECPHCHAAQLKRMISAVGFKLKGSGWYETDFKNKGKKPADQKPEAKKDAPAKTDKKDSKTKDT